MRVLAAALAVLLLVATCSLAHQADLRDSRNAGFPKKDIEPTSCCFSTISRPLPRHMIQSAYRTSNICRVEAVVLVTRNGKQVCADPKAPWLQKHLEEFEFLDF